MTSQLALIWRSEQDSVQLSWPDVVQYDWYVSLYNRAPNDDN